MQHGLLLLVGEADVLELEIAADRAEGDRAVGVFVLGRFVQHLACALQPGDRFGDLRADADHLEQRGSQISQEHGVGEEAAERQLAGENLARAHEHHDRADDAHQRRRRKAHHRGRGERLEDVVQQALDAGAEDLVLARLGVVALHHAHAAERFGQAAGDFGVDLAALAEDGPDGAEGLSQARVRRRAGTPKAMAVMIGLMRISTTKAITAVSRPPTKSTRPVPIRLRTPSTSLMMRETSMPVLFAS